MFSNFALDNVMYYFVDYDDVELNHTISFPMFVINLKSIFTATSLFNFTTETTDFLQILLPFTFLKNVFCLLQN